jgi:plastocyanin
MKRLLVLSAAVGGLVFALTASAAPTNATLVIRHQLRGCHTWSLNGGAFRPSQTVRLAHGGSIVVTDNDVMSHQLVKLSGPAVAYTLVTKGMAMKAAVKQPWGPGMMGSMGASIKVTFPAAGVYTLKTVPGEDYMAGMKTIGEDNVLRLKVVVS